MTGIQAGPIRGTSAAVPDLSSSVFTLDTNSRQSDGFTLTWTPAASPDIPVLGYKVLRDNG